MSDPNKPYEVEAGDQGAAGRPVQPPAPGEPSKARPIDFPPPAAPIQPKGKIDAPELLAGFEEDADFDKDPEVDRVILGTPVAEAKLDPAVAVMEEFVKPGLGGAKAWAIVGGVLLLSALIATGVQAAPSTGQRVLRVLLTLYNTLLHTGTGVVAVFVAATLLGMRLGKFELATARMFAAVAAFALLISMQFRLFGVTTLDRIVVLILAAGAYVLIVATTFNVWKRYPLAYIIGSHFFLWLIVAVGMLLSQVATTPSPSSKPQAPAVQPQPKSTSGDSAPSGS